jgi:aspartate/methionine/tyrosine aminotransferase
VFSAEFVSALQVCDPERTFVVSGVSKGYAMTGFRLGYLIGPAAAWQTARAVIEAMAGCVTSVSQHAAEVALRGPQDCVERARQAYASRLEVVHEILGERVLGDPRGAFYAMVRVGRHPEGSLGFAKELLVRRDVAVAPGVTFGPDWDDTVRICFALDAERLAPALVALAGAADELAG